MVLIKCQQQNQTEGSAFYPSALMIIVLQICANDSHEYVASADNSCSLISGTIFWKKKSIEYIWQVLYKIWGCFTVTSVNFKKKAFLIVFERNTLWMLNSSQLVCCAMTICISSKRAHIAELISPVRFTYSCLKLLLIS